MSRFLDERGRIFGKVNVVDILVLLVIVAVVAFVAARISGNGSQVVPVEVTYSVQGVKQDTVDALEQSVKVKGTARDDSGTLLGQVQSVSATPTLEEYVTPQGQLKAFQSPILSDVDIVVRGQGRVSGSAARIGSVPMQVGRKVVLSGGQFQVQSTILRVVWGAEALK